MTFFRNMAFFAYTVFLAVWQQWTAQDIVWSMWASSLLVGGLCVFTSIAFNSILRKGEITPADIGRMVGHKKLPPEALEKIAASKESFRVPRALSLLATLFFLLFFTAHFGGFHYGHAMFLKGFFPLEGLGEKAPVADYALHCIKLYWPFLVVSLISYGDTIMKNLRGEGSLSMVEPYKNVVKNHLIIIAIGFMNALELQGYVLYIVLAFYFFPYEEVFKARKEDVAL